MPQLVQVGTGEGTEGLEDKLVGQMEELRAVMRRDEEESRDGLSSLAREVASITDSCHLLSDRMTVQEARPEHHTEPVVVQQVEQTTEPQLDSGELVLLRQQVETQLTEVKRLLTTPLSVLFDAVRSEDFLGQDGWLPFTKLNINLGEGMDLESGVFTVPTSGLYLFLINVYGAPRDGVVLSIRYWFLLSHCPIEPLSHRATVPLSH